MQKITLLLLCLLCWTVSFGQKNVYQEVQSKLAQGQSFNEVKLLQFQSSASNARDIDLEGLTKGILLKFDSEAVQQLQQGNAGLIQLALPVSERSDLKLNLIQHQIFSEDFAVYTSLQGKTELNYRPGIHYKGVIEGQPNSLVAISVFDNEIMGVISNQSGNMVLGAVANDREGRHILYHDSDLDRKFDFDCGTADDGIGYTEEELSTPLSSRDVGDCVRVYIEIDDDIVTAKGGGTPATNYITGLFNQSIVLYNNESVNMMISEIYAWVTNSPYSGSSSSAMLTSFQNNSGAFNGNIGHLVSYQASGGIAVLDNLCSTNPDWRKCFSSIDGTYSNVPTYSWSVMVITHEMGHVIGSKHTHSCSWNGNNTAIDGCAGATEGSCPLPGIPSEGGTIMSYCHLTQAGISFPLGFGPQPGNVIRNRVNASGNCLTSCGPPPPPPPPAYCSSNGNNSSYEWINKVVLGSINNTSGNNGGYADYTSQSTSLNAGTGYTINLTPGFGSATYTEYWRVWIDYNNDLDFADAGEQVGQGVGTSQVNISFTVPAGTPSGTKRMRVSMKYSGYPTACESFTYGEVEDYSVAIGGGGGPTCNDGIQNQGETGVDCGGPCAPCATCNDGIQNQGETGVDCGGPCAPCTSCNDGIQNGNETGVDCGGSCPACPTCNDGIQNQGETGVDCGGPCPACPPSGNTVLLASYFENGWDSWADGGSDVTRVNSVNSWEGNYSIRLADNSGTASAMTSPTFSMVGGTGAQIQFYFYAYSMEVGEDFWVRYNNGSGWQTIATFTRGTNFNNNTFYVTTVTVPGFVPTVGTFRIQCDASDNNDQIYIDQVTITRLNGSSLPEAMVELEEVRPTEKPTLSGIDETSQELTVYPNPVQDILNITFQPRIDDIRLVSVDGHAFKVPVQTRETKQLDIHQLAPGLYFLYIQSEGEWLPVRFTKM